MNKIKIVCRHIGDQITTGKEQSQDLSRWTFYDYLLCIEKKSDVLCHFEEAGKDIER